jgi:capsular exopolysaccharide synthesis family protein
MQDNIRQNKVVNTEENPEIDLKQLVYVFISKWYWFLFSVAIMLTAGYFYLKTQAPIYQTRASVLIKQEQAAPEEMFLLKELGYNSPGKSNIDNEIGVFKSPDLIAKIVTSLELNTTYRYTNRTRFYEPDLYKSSPLYVRWEDVEPEKIPSTLNLIFTPRKGGLDVDTYYRHLGSRIERSLRVDTLPAIITLPIGRIYVTLNDSTVKLGRPLKVTIMNAMSVARGITARLNIVTSTKLSSQLDITLKTETPRKGEDFLRALIEEYNAEATADKNKVAFNTAVFIEERLKKIAEELGDVEYEVQEFRKEHQVTDIPAQAGAYLERSSSYESKRGDIETRINLITYIQNYISNPENSSKLIPNLGITDPGLAEIIRKYNDLLLQKEKVQGSTSEINPAYKELNAQVKSMRENIVASLANEMNASQIALNDLEEENTITKSKIRTIPTLSRQLTDITRQQEVKNNLYVYLLQKREETNLTQAGVAPKAKTIAKPYSPGRQVEPKKSFVMLVFLLIGFAIPALVMFLKDYFQTKIEGMKDLSNLKDINVIGDIIKVEEINNGNGSVVVRPNDDSVVNEMFRTLRNNLLFMLSEKDQNAVLVTSTIAKEGKTFIAANLARSLSLMDKKVLLMGGDIRNPKLPGVLAVPKRDTGLSSYLAGQIQDHNEMIEQVEPNFYILQTGPIPPNPNELLSKRRMGELITQLKKEFDYLVIDSAPVGVVSDTFLISKYTDACIYVVRENFSEKDTVSFINNLVHDKRLRNVAVVLNVATNMSTQGRYKYGYKYSYRYRYGYAQGYGKIK